MAELKEAKVGLLDAQELMPKGRIVYEAIRQHVTDRPGRFAVLKKSPAAQLLDRVVAENLTMEPPLPDEVVKTVGDFSRQYQTYVFVEGFGDISQERTRLENVADQLVSVVFEYGYGNIVANSAD